MKRSVLILLAAIALLYSCKKDNPANNPDNGNNTNLQAKISGKWYIKQDTILEYKNGVLNRTVGQFSYATIDPNYYITFNAGGTGTDSNDSGSANFTYSMSGDKITFNYPAYIFSFPDGTSVTEPAFTENATVKILADGRLELFYDDTDTDTRTTEAAYYIR